MNVNIRNSKMVIQFVINLKSNARDTYYDILYLL